MKLRAPTLSKTAEDVIGYSLVAITLPVWIAILLLLGVAWCKRKLIGPTDEWRPWFAWYPVRADWDGWRWLELVERRSSMLLGDIDYRTTPNESTPHHG